MPGALPGATRRRGISVSVLVVQLCASVQALWWRTGAAPTHALRLVLPDAFGPGRGTGGPIRHRDPAATLGA
ncbi:hypothetical protein KO481_37805 [Nocardia sp. NEAU-G5]|uniref:Secreted protein n=1 Tax=Nocardia albiluteola TaxID=2842303 RepID=A0ABS6BAE0_9NOCA|nr:hypothetical protein [Nocardia albiluteola]MBU3067263.1 hypothetical protein [Nocardia albiluteola]